MKSKSVWSGWLYVLEIGTRYYGEGMLFLFWKVLMWWTYIKRSEGHKRQNLWPLWLHSIDALIQILNISTRTSRNGHYDIYLRFTWSTCCTYAVRCNEKYTMNVKRGAIRAMIRTRGDFVVVVVLTDIRKCEIENKDFPKKRWGD